MALRVRTPNLRKADTFNTSADLAAPSVDQRACSMTSRLKPSKPKEGLRDSYHHRWTRITPEVKGAVEVLHPLTT
jgi:hypothetical protein